MEILLFLIPLAFILGLASLAGFMWALNSGQFEDLEGHASRILQPDDEDVPSERKAVETKPGGVKP